MVRRLIVIEEVIVMARRTTTKIDIDQEALAIETFIKEVMRRFPTRWMPELILIKETTTSKTKKVTTWRIAKIGG
jgi:hypothetical protein